MNSRAKGCRGEREWRDQLREAGFLNARRGQQFSGGTDSPDVICPELPKIHFEVKRVEAGNVYKWMAQAERDAQDKTPVVAHKKNHHDWVVVLKAEDFFKLIRSSDWVTTPL
jgi:Holliday junction resolvase